MDELCQECSKKLELIEEIESGFCESCLIRMTDEDEADAAYDRWKDNQLEGIL